MSVLYYKYHTQPLLKIILLLPRSKNTLRGSALCSLFQQEICPESLNQLFLSLTAPEFVMGGG